MSGFAAIIDWLCSFWSWVEKGFLWVLDGIILLLQWVFFLVFDGLLTVVESFFTAIDFSAVAFSYAANWASLPSTLIYLINAVDLPQGLAMLGAAYGLRLVLNLIPSIFTRV